MTKFLFTLLAIMSIAIPASAKDIKTATIKLPTLQCGGCKQTIESKTTLKGLDSISVDVDRKLATVTYDADKTTLRKIEKAIAKVGYNANKVKANKKAKRKLPACCQPGGHADH